VRFYFTGTELLYDYNANFSKAVGAKRLPLTILWTHWRNISGFQQCNFYSDLTLCCRDILLVLKSQLFRQDWPKLGSFLSITLQKKMKIEISKKLTLREKEDLQHSF